MPRKASLLFALAGFVVLPPQASAEPTTGRLGLAPYPREVTVQSGVIQLTGAWTIRLQCDPPDSVGVSGLQSDARTAYALAWQISSEDRGRRIIIRSRPAFGGGTPLLEAQGYELSVAPDSITIAAPTSTGRYYGVQTLRQLIRGSRDGRLPCLRIRDYPALTWRGVSDDISRGQVSTLRDFRATLEHLGFYKINLYCLYIEDMARFWSAPEVGIDRGALTPSELRIIVEEARRYHVTVMPIFQTLGHQERLLALPAFTQYSERPKPNGFVAWWSKTIWSVLPALAQTLGIADPSETPPPPTCFAASNPRARARVTELVDEIAASTPSPFFHLGGDEPSDIGTGASKAQVQKLGRGAVYANYMAPLIRHVETGLERQPVIFSDVLLKERGAMDGIPRSTAIMDWHYEPTDKGESLHQLQSAGFRTVFASPGLWNWFAIFPDYGRAFPNISNLALAAKRERSAGLVVASWGDGGAESLRRANWPGYAYAADASWSSSIDSLGFLDRFVRTEYGVTDVSLGRAIHLLGWQSFPTLGFNQRLFHWAPRLRTHAASWVERMSLLKRDMDEARSVVSSSSKSARFNREGLEVLDNAAARFQYAAEREIILEGVARALGQSSWSSLSGAEQEANRKGIASLRDSLNTLTGQYTRLWTRDNRSAILASLLVRIHGQTVVLDRLLAKAQLGTLQAERGQ